MVWGGILAGGSTDLVLFRRGTLNAAHNLNDIIRSQVIPLMRRLGAGYLFMDDSAPCHRARVVQNELNNNNVTQLDWPARSPDLNPIEQAWDMLGRAVYSMPVRPQTLDALEAALDREWRAIPQNQLDRLIASLPHRIQACIEANGGHTGYWNWLHMFLTWIVVVVHERRHYIFIRFLNLPMEAAILDWFSVLK